MFLDYIGVQFALAIYQSYKKTFGQKVDIYIRAIKNSLLYP